MKLIHCADIHLDSPMQTHMTARQAATRSAEVLRSFVRMTQYARENGVRAVIIAHNLAKVGVAGPSPVFRSILLHI